LIIGRVFAFPASHIRAWRFAAWMVSGVVFAVHIAYEYFRLRNSPRWTAFHAAAGVAIGALGLAIAGMIYTSSIRPAWLLALILWPVFTAVPAFVGALVAATLLRRFSQRTTASAD
jgi:hypothetical protein